MTAPAPLDPSRSSYYVGDALYRELIANFSDWQDDARAVTDSTVRDEFRRPLERDFDAEASELGRRGPFVAHQPRHEGGQRVDAADSAERPRGAAQPFDQFSRLVGVELQHRQQRPQPARRRAGPRAGGGAALVVDAARTPPELDHERLEQLPALCHRGRRPL